MPPDTKPASILVSFAGGPLDGTVESFETLEAKIEVKVQTVFQPVMVNVAADTFNELPEITKKATYCSYYLRVAYPRGLAPVYTYAHARG